VLVISGRRRVAMDAATGKKVERTYRIVKGGGTFIVPVLERVEFRPLQGRDRELLCVPQVAQAPRLDGVLATSAAVREACERHGLGADRIVVVPPGARAATGAGLSREVIARHLGLDPVRHWTLSVAPLEPAARLTRLLWAIDQLGVVRKDLQHVLVGTGPLLGQIRRRARAQELSERLFIVPDCEVIQDLLGEVRLVWQSGDVALGGAILDGMACGVPAVAVASNAARPLVVDGETGRLVPAEPESELPRRAFGILEDADLAHRYGVAGAARAAGEFSAVRFVAGLAEALTRRASP